MMAQIIHDAATANITCVIDQATHVKLKETKMQISEIEKHLSTHVLTGNNLNIGK